MPIEEVILKLRDLNDPKKKLRDCAEILKTEINSINMSLDSYVCDENVLNFFLHNFEIPPNWLFFLQDLLNNKHKFSDNKLRRVKSIFMDIIYVMNGTTTPKHIALAQSIHHLTRSKHIIRILSKLGHSVSYEYLNEHDMLLMKKVILDQPHDSIISPSNIIQNPSLFLHGAMDNNDFMEETLSGKNTTHVTSMVLYQERLESHEREISVTSRDSVNNVNIDSISFQTLEEFSITNNKPRCVFYTDMNNLLSVVDDHSAEIIWILSKYTVSKDNIIERDKDVIIPNWSPFQQVLSVSTQPVCTGLLPFASTRADFTKCRLYGNEEFCFVMPNKR